jgi:hypothetical protein
MTDNNPVRLSSLGDALDEAHDAHLEAGGAMDVSVEALLKRIQALESKLPDDGVHGEKDWPGGALSPYVHIKKWTEGSVYRLINPKCLPHFRVTAIVCVLLQLILVIGSTQLAYLHFVEEAPKDISCQGLRYKNVTIPTCPSDVPELFNPFFAIAKTNHSALDYKDQDLAKALARDTAIELRRATNEMPTQSGVVFAITLFVILCWGADDVALAFLSSVTGVFTIDPLMALFGIALLILYSFVFYGCYLTGLWSFQAGGSDFDTVMNTLVLLMVLDLDEKFVVLFNILDFFLDMATKLYRKVCGK